MKKVAAGQAQAAADTEERTPQLSRAPGTGSPSAAEEPSRARARQEPQPGQVLAGRYTVLEVLGKGGMGLVLAAYDSKLDRRVALKLVQGDTAEHQLRLQREAQALARLSHPNVVAVYDVGELGGGQLFVAMEQVRGVTLGAWCQQQQRPWQQVLQAYVQAGRGLAAAHAAGLVHRDFKPSNVLVGEDGRARVLDFGVVRTRAVGELTPTPSSQRLALEQSVESWEAALTLPGQVVGTPRYMAPEALEGGPADTQSDLFAFCLCLYEALVERPPFAGSSLAERLEAMKQGRVAPVPAGARVPRWVLKAVAQGMKAAPAERPASMQALLELLERDPAQTLRRRLALGALGVLGVALGTLAVVDWRAQAAARAQLCQGAGLRLAGVWDEAVQAQVRQAMLSVDKPYAREAWEKVGERLGEYARGWAAMHREVCEATRLRGEQSEEMMTRRMACLDRRREELRALGRVLAQADSATVQQAAQATQGLAPLKDCSDTEALLSQVPPPRTPQARQAVEALRSELAHVKALRLTARYGQAAQAAQPAVATARALDYPPVLAEALLLQGQTLWYLSPPLANDLLLEAATLAHASRLDGLAAESFTYLCANLWRTGRYQESQSWQPLARAAIARIGGELWLESVLQGLTARRYQQLGQHMLAREQYARMLEPFESTESLPGWQRARVFDSTGEGLLAVGQQAEACRCYSRAHTLFEQALGTHNDRVSYSSLKLLDCRLPQSLQGAQQVLERAYQDLSDVMPPNSPSFGLWHTVAARVALARGQLEQARGHAQAAVALTRTHQTVQEELTALRLLAQVYIRQGQHQEAKETLEQYLQALGKMRGDWPLLHADHALTLAAWHRAQGRHTEALQLSTQVLEERRKALGERAIGLAEAQLELARSMLGLGRAQQALEQARLAQGLIEGQLGAQALWGTEAQQLQAEALLALQQPTEAQALAERALQGVLSEGGEPDRVARLRALLAQAQALLERQTRHQTGP